MHACMPSIPLPSITQLVYLIHWPTTLHAALDHQPLLFAAHREHAKSSRGSRSPRSCGEVKTATFHNVAIGLLKIVTFFYFGWSPHSQAILEKFFQFTSWTYQWAFLLMVFYSTCPSHFSLRGPTLTGLEPYVFCLHPFTFRTCWARRTPMPKGLKYIYQFWSQASCRILATNQSHNKYNNSSPM